MNYEDALNAMQAESRNERVNIYGQLTLGDIITKLELLSPDTPILFDFGPSPTKLDSWRGSYAELALGFTDTTPNTVGNLLTECLSAVNRTFLGYKGGEYTMDRQTSVWVANYGEVGCSVGVRNIVRDTTTVIIVTNIYHYYSWINLVKGEKSWPVPG